jgi:hypothetical protein
MANTLRGAREEEKQKPPARPSDRTRNHAHQGQAFVRCGGLLLGVSTGAWAHHSFASEFDVKSPVEFKGKVVKVELINPHSWIHLEITKRTAPRKSGWWKAAAQPAVPPWHHQAEHSCRRGVEGGRLSVAGQGQARSGPHHHFRRRQVAVLRSTAIPDSPGKSATDQRFTAAAALRRAAQSSHGNSSGG